ncbi:hypothetical protein MAPG_04971 [Magnaporthiopsis poae ATCC 64411]|uniref:Heterokaryon incompatibility domain-containing protein n=1 Tax=Magnaporthiopsis poae (strain ATCC 64411 / 73-15) TaxID=644358 RepID=A0A0C4DY61_MAGP6|nr:hypothetical protein MAPG_04971 [Magnaporthiopsis poae ATCC 64411]
MRKPPTNMPPRLCSRCQNFDVQSFRRDTFRLRGYPLVEFVKSAKSGCSFCGLVLQNLEAAERDHGTKNSLLEMTARHVAGESPHRGAWATSMFSWMWPPWLNIYPAWHPAAEDLETGDQEQDALQICELRAFVAVVLGGETLKLGASPEIHLHVAADPGTPAHSSRDIVGRIEMGSYSWSPYHAQSLALWHQSCTQSHRNCSLALSRRHPIGTGAVPLPTRCVEILSVSADGWNGRPDQLKLVLRETAGQSGRYVALSHRWDQETEATRTTSANYSLQKEECRGAPLFYDAARVAASQGIRYIWVDSLCIIQDDADDWVAESVRMADYYQGAWLTIAAAARHETGGLFGPLQAQEIPRLARLPYRDRQGVRNGHFYLQCAGQKSLTRDYSENVIRSPLFRRGWIYQELVLSRRLLLFSHGSTFVWCSEGTKTLAGGFVEPPESNTDQQPVDRALRSSVFDLDTYANIVSAWENIVETYSGLEISLIDQDRLVALAGVAKEFGEAIRALQTAGQWPRFDASHRYICGMWKSEPSALLWEQFPSVPGRRARLPGIPTWSWASMEMRAPSAAPGKGKGSQVVRRGMGVRWSDKQGGSPTSRKLKRLECDILKAVRVPVDPRKWEPQFGARDAEDAVSTALHEYGNHARFFALRLRGRLLPALVHGFFLSEEDTGIAANATGHGANFGRCLWRRVTTVEDPDSIVGWASLEHPDYQGPDPESPPEDPSQHQQEQNAGSGEDQRQQRPRQPEDLFAFVVESMPKTPGGLGFGNLRGYQTSFKVLYLARKEVSAFGDDGCFERIGTGRLFGNDVEALFRGAEERTLWLV